jgi:hypothetical protein
VFQQPQHNKHTLLYSAKDNTTNGHVWRACSHRYLNIAIWTVLIFYIIMYTERHLCKADVKVIVYSEHPGHIQMLNVMVPRNLKYILLVRNSMYILIADGWRMF